MFTKRHVIAALVSLWTVEASALELGSPEQLLSVDVHAFVSQGFIATTDNYYLAKSIPGSFEFSEIGINFNKALTDNFRIGLQLFARDLGVIGNYSAKMDWYQLDYRWKDWLGLRAGRVKLPFGLYNDTSDVDSARVPILLPSGIYPPQNRDLLLAQTGFEAYGFISLGAGGSLDYRVFGGTIYVDNPRQLSTAPTQIEEISTPFITGGRLLWEAPLEGLRVGGSLQILDLVASVVRNDVAVSLRVPALLGVASLEYAMRDVLIAAEYSRWFIRVESSDTSAYPNSATVSERGYLMASYRLTPWFQPGVYYSALFPNVANREGRSQSQHDFAATLRFDINSYWLIKLEGHYMRGTAGLSAQLNGGTPLSELAPSWGLLLVKTTATF